MYAIVMAGGAGTRFWPLSRKNRPKQLLPLWNGRTLVEMTVERLVPLIPLDRILVVTGRHLAEATAAALPDLPPANLIVEPSARNTMPCIALAASIVRRRDPLATLGVFSADHFVDDDGAFREACRTGFDAASAGRIATIGVRPTRPETGFGYICSVPGEGPVLRVDTFVEKPDRARAEAYLAEGCYFWNAGIFFMSLGKLDEEVARQRPELHRHWQDLSRALDRGDPDAVAAAFNQLTSTSVDYAIMESARDVVVIPAEFKWNDVGHWAALREVMATDDAGNITRGDVLVVDSTDSVVINLPSKGLPSKGQQAEGRLLAVVGIEGIAVIQTADATLVLPCEQSQRVRDVVTALKANGRTDLL